MHKSQTQTLWRFLIYAPLSHILPTLSHEREQIIQLTSLGNVSGHRRVLTMSVEKPEFVPFLKKASAFFTFVLSLRRSGL